MSDLSRDLASLRIDRAEPAPRKVPSWLLWVVLVGLLVAGGVAAAPKLAARFFKPEVKVTEILLVSPAQAAIQLSSTGYVLPQVVAKVGTKIVGRVAKVNVREGKDVNAGDVLFELDPTDQKSALAAAQAKVSAAGARAIAAKARAEAAKANAEEVRAQLARQKKLVDAGTAAASTVEDLELRLKGLDAQVAVAQADAAAAQADAAAAGVDVGVFRSNLSSTIIVAPISGRATTKPTEIGDVVNPGQTLVELADFTSLLVETDVPETRLGGIKPGMPTEIVLDAFPTTRLRGEVAELVPKLNRAKATGTVKVKILDKLDGILPEMAARVSFLEKPLGEGDMKEPARKIVPPGAVVDRGGAKHVFVVDSGKVRLVPVRVGAPFGGGLTLEDGPPPGTRVVKDPPADLADGQAVKEGTS